MARAAIWSYTRTATTSGSTSTTHTTPTARTTPPGAVPCRLPRTGSKFRSAPARRRLRPGMRRAPKHSAKSAGLVLYRRRNGNLEVLLVHPGGPFWQKRDQATWANAADELADNEEGMDVARREFQEELGQAEHHRQSSLCRETGDVGGKLVQAWALPG